MCRDKVFLLMHHRIFSESRNFGGVPCNSIARSFFVESCGPGTEILEPMMAFVHDQRSAPSLSSRRTLIRFCFIASYTKIQSSCLTSLTSWNTSEVTSVPLLHTCSHSPRDNAQAEVADHLQPL
ncbi:hypothetical protein DAPPUDRAFT_237190 [Daphnia pulex]|uniref:Uncharacterized protein n=1 Tax=Daphnia pulex TaxID=6669 RepID=E9G396_DAPPU|nr:hypothetical protein DAPPUDRAFT_237190 [Daphnia pulex]|eukprot:EFX86026.1 hypothetical protein DAPPUDRAFT_237190 [Daphnia pulex]